MPSLNVSEIHLCQRCSRLLAYHLAGKKQVWRIGLVASESFPSKFFHDKIVRQLHKKLSSPHSHLFKAVVRICKSPKDNFHSRFLETLENYFFLSFLNKHSQELETSNLLQTGKAFEKWCAFLSEFLCQIVQKMGDNFLLSEIFYPPEKLISQTYESSSEKKLTVNGRYDAILFDTQEKEIVILECKGRDMDRADEDMTQVALYAWLISQQTGIIPRAVILYLTGEQERYHVSKDEMKSLIQQMPNLFDHVIQIIEANANKMQIFLPRSVDKNLCKRCPFNFRCDNDYGQEVPKASGIDDMLDLFHKLNLPVFDAGNICGPRFIRYKLKPDFSKKVTVTKIQKRALDLQVAMNLPDIPLIQAQAGYVSIDIPRKVRKPLTLGEVMRKAASTRPASKVAFPIGMAIDGTIVWINLNDPASPSILVGGTSGSGKSVLLRSILIALAINANPDELKFSLIDSKHVSFQDLSDIPHIDGDIIVENSIAIEKLRELVEEMNQRYSAFKKVKAFDINGYQEKGYQVPHHVVMIDEYADLIIDKQTKNDLETTIQKLGQKGRAAGIHLILATQRPDARIVTPLIKANLQLKVALKVTTPSNSNIIIDQPGAECLIGRGDMLIAGSVPVKRLQGPIASKTDIDQTKTSLI
jgi:S-DNA-T family DNA segregation ATPase FtsK/SpoIIIE